MLGFLIVLALVAGVVYAFGRILRRRVQSNLQRAGVELPPEIVSAQARVAAKAAAPATRVAALTPAVAGVSARAAPHFLLIYDVGPDFAQRRAEFREAHLALAWKAADAGELVLAGALESEQALLLFRGTRDAALRFAAADPYVKHGLVKGFKVKQWHTTVGKTAAAPLRPEVVAAGRLK